mgnify:CR=1 FL=1
MVINDEAHHAWRMTNGKKQSSKEDKEERERATVWINGLDRINRTAGILTCYDFSATPFVPGGDEKEGLFSWIVSDFSLSDGIESGLVKTPYVVVRDNAAPDAKDYRSKLYHIYQDDEVKSNLTKPNQPKQADLPELVCSAYMMLAADWKIKYDEWCEHNKKTPPVMITVANRTETAARVEYMFEQNNINLPEELCTPEHMLRIDSQKIKTANDKDAEFLRLVADTVGKEGQPGEQKCNIISVGMLSEGWDAKTVTHIMGLRAFSSQLLCEQVVGRGLRRTSYELEDDRELFPPEYVNIFGIPFEFLPFEKSEDRPPVEKEKFKIEALDSRREFEISWPNVTRLEYVMNQRLSLDSKIPALELDVTNMRTSAELAPVLAGRTDLTKCSDIELEDLYSRFRLQQIIFRTANRVYNEMKTQWQAKDVKLNLIGQVVNLTEKYLNEIRIFPQEFPTTEAKRKIVFAFNMERIMKHIWEYIKSENVEKILPVLDLERKERSTGDMPEWITSKPNNITRKSHINRCVYDSAWESSAAYQLEKNPDVKAWAKNDHLGFYISYVYGGVTRRYIPDFLVKLSDDSMLVLETKGIETEQDKIKFQALRDWVEAVNNIKIFGKWHCEISTDTASIDAKIQKTILL